MKKLLTLVTLSLFTIAIGCQEEPTVGDKIRDVGDGIGDAVEEVGGEIEDVKDEVNEE